MDGVTWTNELTKAEFDCKHTGRNEMRPEFIAALQRVREKCGFAFKITSGYRDPSHPEEAKKKHPGYHSKGIAVDIACGSDKAFEIIKHALEEGFTGVGVSQRSGRVRFIHLDMRPISDTPRIYSY